MITFHAEALRDCLEELKPLFDPHWAELALNQDKVPLSPQYDIYLAREALGQVLCVTARDAGVICAYFVGFVAPGMHYSTCLTLTMDICWVAPLWRGEDSLGKVEQELLLLDLLRFVKDEAIRRGVQRCFYGTKVHKDIGRLYEELGLTEVERYYSAWWGE